MTVGTKSSQNMEQTKTTLDRIISVKNKWNKTLATGAMNEAGETAKNCNEEFDFVNFYSFPMPPSTELESDGDLRLEIGENLYRTTETRRGELWVMSGRFLSRWRQQFCVLTKNSMYFFSNSTGMGSNWKISKITLSDICDVLMISEKGQLILCLEVNKLKKIILRKEEGIRSWYDDILANIASLKAKNYRRCFSVDHQSRPNRPLMGVGSLRYDI